MLPRLHRQIDKPPDRTPRTNARRPDRAVSEGFNVTEGKSATFCPFGPQGRLFDPMAETGSPAQDRTVNYWNLL